MTTQRVTIDGNEYTKSSVQGRYCVSIDYRMLRTDANGKKSLAILDKRTHRRMIARIEMALAATVAS